MDELAKLARAELEPPWDDVREARVLSRVLDEAGFTSVEAMRVDGDIVNAYFIATKG